jgi:hypothetical protein
MRKRLTPGVVLGIIAVGFAMSGSAVAGSLITSAKIKDGTIRNKDIKKGTIALDRFTKGTQAAIARAGQPGPAGANGAAGRDGANGLDGTTTTLPAPTPTPTATPEPEPEATAGNWGFINRNAIGAPTAFLRSGPADAPVGDGALNLTVRDGTEKVAYGNETDFVGDDFSAVDAVGFRVYTTGENIGKAPAGTPNMPGIIFEIDPNVDGKATNYSSAVFMPGNSPANAWSPYIDATTTGFWGLTGGAFAGTTCDINGARCTFAQLMDYLDDGDGNTPKILSVAVGKGRDYFWSGAVDGLRVNDTVFDFEERGVFTTAP